MNPILRHHQRALRSRLAAWDGRISNRALDLSLRYYELRVVAYAWAIVCVVLLVPFAIANVVIAPYICLVVGIAGGWAALYLGMKYLRDAISEVRHQYGLTWQASQTMRLITPEQFDRWLANQHRADGNNGAPS